MSIRVYDGATWNNQKSLQIYNGSLWVKSQRGWVYNGSAWSQFYPEYPAFTVAPLISGNAIQGNTLTVSNGTWNNFDAYIPTSYSYQWRADGANVGTNSSSYQTQLTDVNKTITCVVTAGNNRGTTPATSSNGILIQPANPDPPTSVTISDVTEFSPQPSLVTVTALAQPDGQTIANVQGSAGTVQAGQVTAAYYEGYSSIGSMGAINQSNLFAQITNGTPGASVIAYMRSANNGTKVRATWTTVSLATSYDITFYGSNGAILGPYNTTATSYTLQVNTSGINWYATVFSRNAAGPSLTGRSSTSLAPSIKFSAYTSGSAAFQVQALPSFTTSPYATNILDTSALIAWAATNQAQYNVNSTGWTATTPGTGVGYSRTITGLVEGNYYSPLVEIKSQTLNYLATYVPQFQTPIIPTVTSMTASSIGNTSATISWTSTKQASYSLTGSPTFPLQPYTGFAALSRIVTSLTAGTPYTALLTIYSSTNYPGYGSVGFTTTGGTPTVPGTPTLTYVPANNTTSTWGYSASWGASSGTGTIQYQISASGSSGGSATLGLYSTSSASFNLSTSDTTWSIKVRATNDGGATWSAYSGLSNSA